MKIISTTVKNFAKKNEGNLFVKHLSYFDGMTDGTTYVENSGFKKIEKPVNLEEKNSLGIGVWFVGRSRDYFTAFNQDGFTGYEVSNSCGNFIIAKKV